MLDRFSLRQQARCIVAAALGRARAARRGARVMLRDPQRHRLVAALEVGADGAGDHHEQIFVRRAHTEERLGREHEGAQIQAAVVAGDPGEVRLHQLVDGLEKQVFRQFGHGKARSRRIETAGVLLRAEQGNAAVVAPIGLQTFENLLAVVQHRRGGIERDRLAGAQLRILPSAVPGPADRHHVVGEHAPEPRILEQSGTHVGGDGCRVWADGKREFLRSAHMPKFRKSFRETGNPLWFRSQLHRSHHGIAAAASISEARPGARYVAMQQSGLDNWSRRFPPSRDFLLRRRRQA